MLVLRVSKEETKALYSYAYKFRKNMKQGLLLGDVAYSDTAVYFIVPDEALSAAFLYGVYLKAKKRGLVIEAMYAIKIDLDEVLPKNVKEVGRSWLSRRLSKEEINLLKNKFITPNLLEVVLK